LADAPDIDPAVFRQVLGHFPTGVTIVTAAPDHKPVGLAVGSFTSLSLEPPLVAFCPGNSSTSWPHIQQAGTFCVNILSADQEGLCRHFAGKSDDKFAGIGWKTSPLGSPILDGVLAWIDCTIEVVHPGGDHVIVVGRVHDLEVAHGGGPLVFFRGGYGRFEV
jgi:3-hydroxy-9,10-secoandrosta-1,3,5(10)-triene-9,17-dione monooxygenase reductase component